MPGASARVGGWFREKAGNSWLASQLDKWGVGETEPGSCAPLTGNGEDVSNRFGDLLGRAEKGENVLPKNAGEFIYLQVGGIFTEHYPGYMAGNNERLQKSGVEAQQVPIDTDAGVTENAKAIRDYVLAATKKAGKKAVLTGHSKGGVDIGAAMSLYPELKAAVHAVVSMNAPIKGSQIAQDFKDNSLGDKAASGVIKNVFRGDPEALRDLTYERREAFNTAHPYPQDVSTVSMAGSSDNEHSSGMMPLVAHIRAQAGKPSDGMVAPSDAVLPGSDVVRVNDIDHAEGAMKGMSGVGAHDPGSIQLAMVTLALERAERDKKRKEGAKTAGAPEARK